MFVELTKVSGGFIVVNLDEVLTITESNTSQVTLKGISYRGSFSIITFRNRQAPKILVKEPIPEIRNKHSRKEEKDLW